MKFIINVFYLKYTYRYQVERVFADERIERFKISGRNKSLILESNRPLFEKKQLKSRKPDWSLIEGVINNKSFLDALTSSLNDSLKQPETLKRRKEGRG